jgi:hypothetical protein
MLARYFISLSTLLYLTGLTACGSNNQNYGASNSSTTSSNPDSTYEMIRNSERLRMQENAHLDFMEKWREQNRRKAKSFCISDPNTCQ